MSGLRYTKEHEWIRVDGDVATIGITAYAQEQLGDIVFVELPEPGKDDPWKGKITMRDTGAGMTPEELARAEGTLRSEASEGEGSGQGLGIRLARQLIEAQNDLVKAQQAYIDYLANADYTAAPDIKKDEASALKLGTITNPKPEQSSAKGLADYGLSGDTQLISDDTKLTSICGELAAANTALDLKGEARF